MNTAAKPRLVNVFHVFHQGSMLEVLSPCTLKHWLISDAPKSGLSASSTFPLSTMPDLKTRILAGMEADATTNGGILKTAGLYCWCHAQGQKKGEGRFQVRTSASSDHKCPHARHWNYAKLFSHGIWLQPFFSPPRSWHCLGHMNSKLIHSKLWGWAAGFF